MAGSTSAGERERRRGQVRRGGCAGHQLASDMHNRYISRTATLNTEANKSNIQMKIFFLTFKAFLILIRSQGEKKHTVCDCLSEIYKI